MDENNGKWVTIKGRHIFLKDGQSVSDAINEYETYKKAKETPEEITPMEENSTDFESLNSIYGDKEESDNSGEEYDKLKKVEKEYNDLSQKMQDDDYYYKPEDDKKLKELRTDADTLRTKLDIDSQEKLDNLTKEIEENKSYPQSVGSPSFEDMGLNVRDKKGFSEYLRDNYGTDDFRVINFENKEGAKGIYSNFIESENNRNINSLNSGDSFDITTEDGTMGNYTVVDNTDDNISAKVNYINSPDYIVPEKPVDFSKDKLRKYYEDGATIKKYY